MFDTNQIHSTGQYTTVCYWSFIFVQTEVNSLISMSEKRCHYFFTGVYYGGYCFQVLIQLLLIIQQTVTMALQKKIHVPYKINNPDSFQCTRSSLSQGNLGLMICRGFFKQQITTWSHWGDTFAGFTHLRLVPNMCVGEVCHHWFR